MNAIQMKSLCERLFNVILIKITQNHYLETIFLQNRNTDFDETLHVVWVCPPLPHFVKPKLRVKNREK